MADVRYHLSITVEERNEDYEAEMAKRRERSYGYINGEMPESPQLYRQINVLDVRVTLEQFEAIKRAALETFK